MENKYLKCSKCGHIHFMVTREYAQNEVERFNEYFNSLSKEKQESYYGGNPSNIASYERCLMCSETHKTAIDCEEWEIPMGVTLNPMIKDN